MTNLSKEVKWLVDNWDKIPDSFKTNLQTESYRQKGVIPDVPLEEHVVILLLNRQKPSVSQSDDFDEERIAVTRSGRVIWGFDSGCSCPSPWDDSYPECYNVEKTWKQFTVDLDSKSFDPDFLDVCAEKITEIKKAVTDHHE